MYSQKVFGYFKSWVNMIELAQCISVAVFLFDVGGDRCFCLTRREWEAGIVSLSLTWIVLFVWLQTMHWIGIYVTIMLKIIYSFIKVAMFGLLLIVAFGLSFYMLFYRPPKEVSYKRILLMQSNWLVATIMWNHVIAYIHGVSVM